MAFPPNFNPGTYLYLNPELQAYSNVMTIEAASNYYATNPLAASHCNSLSIVPNDFDSTIFIHSSKDGINISGINQVIKMAMSNDGYTSEELNTFSSFIQSIQQHIAYQGSNTFAFTDPFYVVTDFKLMVNDDIRIVAENEYDVISRVESINSNTSPNMFTVSNYLPYTFDTSFSNYVLFGQRLYDIDRLAKINWVRGLRSVDPYGSTYKIDTYFNPDLYRLLYPSARGLDNTQSLLDYLTYRNNGDLRIGREDQLRQTIDDEFVIIANTKVEWSSNASAFAVEKAIWSSNYAGSYLTTSTAQQLFAPSNTTNDRLNWNSNALSNVFRANGYDIVVNSLTPNVNNAITANGNWAYTSNVSVQGTATIGQNLAGITLDVRGTVRADDYVLTSDMRTKSVLAPVDIGACLDFVRRASVMQYSMKNDGYTKRVGFLAQDLEELQPQLGDVDLVKTVNDFIPNIMAKTAIDTQGAVALTESQAASLSPGDLVKLVVDDLHYTVNIDSIRGSTVQLKLPTPFPLPVYDAFFYGKRVDDFKVIDQSQLFAIVFGALQRLAERVESLEKNIVA